MIYIGSDHAGFKLKEKIRQYLTKKRIDWEDLGTHSDKKKVDYPDFAKLVAKKTVKTNSLGILICGSAIGMTIAANKIKGARAFQAYDKYTAIHGRENDHTNIICLRGNKSPDSQIKILEYWLKAKPLNEARFLRRVKKVNAL
jgi:ribose 5-phosphate isomerase B|tara:strand:- start:80 stop:508 length:429 start_codon:yes stop_codon:yes gene_type:complete